MFEGGTGVREAESCGLTPNRATAEIRAKTEKSTNGPVSAPTMAQDDNSDFPGHNRLL